jgi:hypothetical protein
MPDVQRQRISGHSPYEPGTSLEHVVRTRMFITDAAHWPKVARAARAPDNRPPDEQAAGQTACRLPQACGCAGS